MSAAPKYASQAVEDFQESTGLADNFDGVISAVQFTQTPPNDNYTVEGNPIFSIWHFVLAGDGPVQERTVSQSYSLGAKAGDNFDISSDGYGLIPKTADSTLRKDSKHGTMVGSLQAEGLPKAILQAGDFSKVIGLSGHFKRVADKERTFTNNSARPGVKKFPPSTLVCTKIIALPGAGSTPVAAAGASSTAAAASSAPSGDIDAKAGAYLAQVVKAKGGKVQKSQLLLLLATAAKADADKQAIAKRGSSEEFLISINEAGGVVDAAGEAVAIQFDSASKPQVVSIAA